MRKRQRLIPYKKLMRLAVTAFNGWVRNRDNACVICGKRRRPTAGHLITAKRSAVRFNEINTNRQCAPCNFKHEHYPEIYTAWFLGRYGLEAFIEIVHQSMQEKKYTRAELHQIIEKYSQ